MRDYIESSNDLRYFLDLALVRMNKSDDLTELSLLKDRVDNYINRIVFLNTKRITDFNTEIDR